MSDQPTKQLHSGSDSSTSRGLLYGLCAYLIWGLFPAFFKLIGTVPPAQIVAHRIVWSLVLLLIICLAQGRCNDIRAVLSDRRSLLILLTTSLLLAANWLVFIIAIDHGEILQSSLGYFINPLVSVLLGRFFLHEKLRRLQLCALLLAVIGVLALTIRYGSFPWTAMTLALTFGSYGLLRKIVKTDSLAGLTVETIIMTPVALFYLIHVEYQGSGAFLHSTTAVQLLLMSSGIVTALPLLLFAGAARRLRLATIGFLQYITPTMHFLLAVAVYNEPFSAAQLTSFVCIWAGLLVYSWDAWLMIRSQRTTGGAV